MKSVNIFSARDLRNHAGALLQEAEEGRLAVITKHGRPTAISVPFDSELLEQGVHRHLAVQLFGQRLVTLAQAAKLAGMSIEPFLDVLKVSGVDVVDYPSDEVGDDLDAVR